MEVHLTFNEVRAKIINYFIANGEKKVEGMIFYDSIEKSYFWCYNIKAIVTTIKNINITDIKYFKMSKSKGLEIE